MVSLTDLFSFMQQYEFVAVEWDLENQELIAFIPNPRCDVKGEAGLEPMEESEFTKSSRTRKAFIDLAKKLETSHSFFLKSPPRRYGSNNSGSHA